MSALPRSDESVNAVNALLDQVKDANGARRWMQLFPDAERMLLPAAITTRWVMIPKPSPHGSGAGIRRLFWSAGTTSPAG
jgi:hypothetical protein